MADWDTPTFALERFAWDAPDQLQLVGVFSGLERVPADDAVLVVQGPDGMRRLPAISHTDGGPAGHGDRWSAAFGWLEAPVAFDRARLELGTDIAVELPAPGDGVAEGPIPVRAAPHGNGAAPAPTPVPADVTGAADRLRREAELLEETLATAARARVETEQRAQATIVALQQRVAELEPASIELASTREELEQTRDALAAARAALADARSGAQELLDRLSRIPDPAAGGR